MEDLKAMKKQLMAAAQGQMGNLENVNAKELGEVIDMIKDLEEAIYYCSIVKAMDESKEEKKYDEIATSLMMRNNIEQQKFYPFWRNPIMDRDNYFYDGNGNNNTSNGTNTGGNGNRSYTENPVYNRQTIRDSREGRSGMSRRNYMENKETHQPKEKQIQELENYMQELSSDITEMIRDATQDEKVMLQQKLQTLASKVAI